MKSDDLPVLTGDKKAPFTRHSDLGLSAGAVSRRHLTSSVLIADLRRDTSNIATVPVSSCRSTSMETGGAALADDDDRPRLPPARHRSRRDPPALTWAVGLASASREAGRAALRQHSLRLAQYSTWRAYWKTPRDRHSPRWLVAELCVGS